MICFRDRAKLNAFKKSVAGDHGYDNRLKVPHRDYKLFHQYIAPEGNERHLWCLWPFHSTKKSDRTVSKHRVIQLVRW